MKMVYALIRPEKEREVVVSLEKAGVFAYTRYGVSGRGRQKGLQVGPVRYEELSKVALMLVVDDADMERVVDTIKISARTGNPGDGKIFTSHLAEARTIRQSGQAKK